MRLNPCCTPTGPAIHSEVLASQLVIIGTIILSLYVSVYHSQSLPFCAPWPSYFLLACGDSFRRNVHVCGATITPCCCCLLCLLAHCDSILSSTSFQLCGECITFPFRSAISHYTLWCGLLLPALETLSTRSTFIQDFLQPAVSIQ